MPKDLSDWSHLWTSGDYVLHRVGPSPSNVLIVDTKRNGALLIEDNDLSHALVAKMREEGVPEVRELPEGSLPAAQAVVDMIDKGYTADQINEELERLKRQKD